MTTASSPSLHDFPNTVLALICQYAAKKPFDLVTQEEEIRRNRMEISWLIPGNYSELAASSKSAITSTAGFFDKDNKKDSKFDASLFREFALLQVLGNMPVDTNYAQVVPQLLLQSELKETDCRPITKEIFRRLIELQKLVAALNSTNTSAASAPASATAAVASVKEISHGSGAGPAGGRRKRGK